MAWCRWEDTHVSLAPDWSPSPRYDGAAFRTVFARLVLHYWRHGCFLADGQLLTGMARLAATPGVLIHGRHDVSGPLDTAWTLHQSGPGSRLVVLEAGHGGGTFPRRAQECARRVPRPSPVQPPLNFPLAAHRVGGRLARRVKPGLDDLGALVEGECEEVLESLAEGDRRQVRAAGLKSGKDVSGVGKGAEDVADHVVGRRCRVEAGSPP